MLLVCTMGLLFTVGCQQQQVGSGVEMDQSHLAELVADGDVNDPTAIVLHELAGSFLMYQARTDKLPSDLRELVAMGLAQPAQLIDPATGDAFLYTPDSKRQPRSPGRVMICQAQSQGIVGRWALLVDDLASNGRIVTYVQRIPDAWLPQKKQDSNAVRLMR